MTALDLLRLGHDLADVWHLSQAFVPIGTTRQQWAASAQAELDRLDDLDALHHAATGRI